MENNSIIDSFISSANAELNGQFASSEVITNKVLKFKGPTPVNEEIKSTAKAESTEDKLGEILRRMEKLSGELTRSSAALNNII